MSIAADRDRRLWLLSTPGTSYVVHLGDDGRLVQLHWGAWVSLVEAAMLPREPFATRPYGLPLEIEEELPVDGGLRWGVPSLQVTFAGGVRSLELGFVADRVEAEEGGARLDLVLADDRFPLQVVLHYRVRDDSDVIERWVTLRHTGEDAPPISIHRADSGNWLIPELPDYRYSAVSGSWAAEGQLRRAPLPDGELTLANRQSSPAHHTNPWIMIDDGTATEESGQVWSIALAWSGTWRLTAQRRFEGRAAVTAGFGHDGVTWRLHAGQELTSPPVLGVHSDGGFGAASRAWHRHARTAVLPHPDEVRPVLYNSWEAVTFDVDETSQIEIARKAADLGAELFVVDDGWFGGRVNSRAGLGDWWPNADRFPDGLGRLVGEVRKLGMDFGLWVEPEMVNPDSDLYRAHPDWVIHYPNRRRDELRTQLVLNFARQDVRAWAYDWLDGLVADHEIDYLKWDMNRALAQGGWPAREQDPEGGDQDRLWIDHTRGVYTIMDRLRANHPRLRIESCAGGGGRVDFGILARTDQVWTSDNTGALHRQSIQHGFSQLYPATVMSAWVTDSNAIPLQYRFHVAMAGALGIGGNLHHWTRDETDTARHLIDQYKQIRVTVQHGDQYRLGGRPGRDLSAVSYVHHDEVIVFLYHPHPDVQPPMRALRLAGLAPDGLYEDTDNPEYRATGRILMTTGLPLRNRLTPDHWASTLIRLHRIQ